jgi:Tlde1 domain
MTCTSATYSDVTAFGGRAVAFGDYRRRILCGLGVGLAAIATVAALIGSVTVAASWLIAASLATHPNLQARVPTVLRSAALVAPYRRLAGAANVAASGRGLIDFANAPHPRRMAELTLAPMPLTASPLQFAPPAAVSVPAHAPRLPPRRPARLASGVPLPPHRPHLARHEIARAPAVPAAAPAPAAPKLAAATPKPPKLAALKAVTTTPEPPKPAAPKLAVVPPAPPKPQAPKVAAVAPEPPKPARNDSASVPSRTAVYDIAAHTVYLPNGERLEAHSGLGHRRDDPRYASKKNRGPTPPNVYDLSLREHLFHGVRAIRLNPVDEDKMYGRDGMLAHTYMLGPTGQSYGCVSFKNYKAFLQAYLKGEVERLVVVPHLDGKPSQVAARAARGHGERYAFNN